MVMVHRSGPVTTAAIGVLEAAGLRVFDGKVDDDFNPWLGLPGQSGFESYVAVEPIPGGSVAGTLGEPYVFGFDLFHLLAVGANRAMCQNTADDARVALLTGTYAIAGRTVVDVDVDGVTGGAVPDNDVLPVVWFSRERFRFRTST